MGAFAKMGSNIYLVLLAFWQPSALFLTLSDMPHDRLTSEKWIRRIVAVQRCASSRWKMLRSVRFHRCLHHCSRQRKSPWQPIMPPSRGARQFPQTVWPAKVGAFSEWAAQTVISPVNILNDFSFSIFIFQFFNTKQQQIQKMKSPPNRKRSRSHRAISTMSSSNRCSAG